MSKSLLADIEEFLELRGISGHRFGMLAAKNGRLVERLRDGGRVWPETEEKIRAFIQTQTAQPSPESSRQR